MKKFLSDVQALGVPNFLIHNSVVHGENSTYMACAYTFFHEHICLNFYVDTCIALPVVEPSFSNLMFFLKEKEG